MQRNQSKDCSPPLFVQKLQINWIKSLKEKREKRYAEKKKKQQKDVYLQYERQVNTKKKQYNPKFSPTLQRGSDFANTAIPSYLWAWLNDILSFFKIYIIYNHQSHVPVCKERYYGPNIPTEFLLSILNTAQEVCKIVLPLASESHCCQARRGTETSSQMREQWNLEIQEAAASSVKKNLGWLQLDQEQGDGRSSLQAESLQQLPWHSSALTLE